MNTETNSLASSDIRVQPKIDLGALPFISSVFLGALLIFLVQPMFAKMATPLLGGSPSVWNVSLVCFQAALLAGYGYAHLLVRLKSFRLQIAIHGLMIATGSICLPLGLTGMFGEPNPDHPALWLIGVFLLSIALPFAAVSATAPLIQSWYARTTRHDAGDPYHLYAASNIGSLIGLAAYPLLLEPFTRLATQSQTWSIGYGILFLLLMASGIFAFRQSDTAKAAQDRFTEAVPLSWRERVIWLGLAFIPSSLLVGATTHITTDVAAAPFLWVPPLILYLLTFVFAFAKKPPISADTAVRFQPVIVAAIALMLPRIVDLGWFLELGFTLAGLFWASLTCHSLLAGRRPHVSRLTEFYLIMSVGGVLGGAFNALLAPVIFNLVLEYPLVLAASLLVLPSSGEAFGRKARLTLIAVCLVFAVALVYRAVGYYPDQLWITLLVVIPTLGIVLSRGHRWLMVICFSIAVYAGISLDPVAIGHSQRGFFGIVKVIEVEDQRAMMHGTTLHGAQYTDKARALQPLTYYAPETPIGQTFTLYDDVKSVGVIGLGVGSVSCYSQPGQNWTFYEIDPIVVRLANDPSAFTFVSECQPDARMVTGDARIKLAHDPDGAFDLLFLDAFSSDAIPVHLVTREAMRLYLSKLSENGVFLAHISNRHLALDKVFARLAESEGAIALVQIYRPEDDSSGFDVTSTNAMLFARDEKTLERALATGKWEKISSDGERAWTDDYTNVIAAMIDHQKRKVKH